ncbi:hypothetical protein [Nostoc sp. NZL]|uniref:hypothetical protein n=1 Tax=Nostoc sp. NZL TaxID=2650612 RepID=UPI0018C46245|nr:hypothetical protein [Nostoc sp. NZL]MBG1244599.1 hypothetical protein [Nostoc sp. NZL]
MAPSIEINLPEGVLQRLQTARDIVNQSVNSFSNSVQQAGQSLQDTAATTTDRAINTITTTLEQAKGSLEQSWQPIDQFKSTTSGAVKTAMSSSVNDWLTQQPIVYRLVQILGWAANHPIISLVILLVALALIWSIIKAIVRLIETASWSILQVPLKLLQALMKVSFLFLTKIGSSAIHRITPTKTIDNLPALPPENFQQNKQQRLVEISSRLEAIQKEQNELLQEAANLIASDTIDIEISKIKQLRSVESHLG